MNYYFVLDIHVGCRSVLLGICIDNKFRIFALDTDPYILIQMLMGFHSTGTYRQPSSFPTFSVQENVDFFSFLYSTVFRQKLGFEFCPTRAALKEGNIFFCSWSGRFFRDEVRYTEST